MSEYVITIESGPDEGRNWVLSEGDRQVLGRDERVAIRLEHDGKISRAHAWVRWRPEGVEVHDAQSTHGTFVEGLPTKGPTVVPLGGSFQVGDTVLRVTALDALDLDELNDYRSVASLPPGSISLDTADVVDVAYPGQARAGEIVAEGPGELRPEDPARVGPYQTIRVLGRGVYGAVYEAIHGVTLQRVALKVIRPEQRPSSSVLQRFHKEQDLLRSITHPNIVACLEADIVSARVGGQSEPVPYIAMELLAGGSLEPYARRKNPLAQALRWAADIFRGLGEAHRHGVVHRDVKPGNVLLTHRASATAPSRARLADFGLAKVLAPAFPSTTATHEARAVGVQVTTSPELVAHFGDAQPASDLYAAAAVTFLTLTGRPHLADIDLDATPTLMQLAHAIRDGERLSVATQRKDVPEEVAFLIDSLLTADGAVRKGARADDLADRLEQSLRTLRSAS